MLWLVEGEVSKLQHRIPETIRLQRRYWELYQFNWIKEGARSGRPSSISAEYQQIILDWIKAEPLNAEQIRTKLHEQYALDIKATNIRRLLNLSGIVYKITRHCLKKKKPDWIWTSSARYWVITGKGFTWWNRTWLCWWVRLFSHTE